MIVREKSAYRAQEYEAKLKQGEQQIGEYGDPLLDSPLRDPFEHPLHAFECLASEDQWELGVLTGQALSFFRKVRKQLGDLSEREWTVFLAGMIRRELDWYVVLRCYLPDPKRAKLPPDSEVSK
jgi:hypothetical protein